MNFTWSSSLSVSFSGCLSLIFSSWHAAPSSPLCNKSVSDLPPMSVFASSVAWETKFSRGLQPWACKYPPRLITRVEHRATTSPFSLAHYIKWESEAAGGRLEMRASVRPPKTKVRCICMQLNSEECVFNRVRMSCSVMYYSATCVCVCVCVLVCECAAACAWRCIARLNPPGLYMFSLWLMKCLKSGEKDSGDSNTGGWLTSLLSALTDDPRRTFSVSLKWD